MTDRPSDHQALERGTGIHTYIGVSIQDEGELRLVAYVNPQPSKIRR